VTLAVAVDEAVVPANGVLCTFVRVPDSGCSETWTTVPTGTFAACNAIFTGFVVEAGRTTSGVPLNEPDGFVGALIPAIDVIDNCGAFGKVTEPGLE
jgi:hypothetical protein